MLNVVGLSLGSSSRNHQASFKLLDTEISVKRIGVDGDIGKAKVMLKEMDGEVDAVGLGGIDLYLIAGGKKYIIQQARELRDCVKKTPFVDGSGLKNTLEPAAIKYLQDNKVIDFTGKKVLLVSAADRFGMAETLHELNAEILFGDLIFGLGIPIPIYKMSTFTATARILLPIVTRMPIKMLYPIGVEQDKNPSGRYSKYYERAEIIAGDYHLIKKYMPEDMEGKTIITNTITEKDIIQLRSRKLASLITTTPNIDGRSFGTNVLEAMFVSILNKQLQTVSEDNYEKILDEIVYKPRIENFNE